MYVHKVTVLCYAASSVVGVARVLLLCAGAFWLPLPLANMRTTDVYTLFSNNE